MNNVKISINIVTYNRAEYIAEAIESILIQSFSDWELIIIDDNSSDNTKSIIDEYIAKDKRVKSFKNDHNLGISKSRNIALKQSQGKYIAVLDSDDFWCDKDKLKKQYEYLEKNTDYVLAGGSFTKIDKSGKEILKIVNFSTNKDIRNRFLFKNPIAHSTVMYKRDLAILLGGYNESLDVGEDYDLWLKMGQKGKLFNFTDNFVKYRVHDDNICLTDKLKSLRVLDVIKKYKDIYPNYYLAFLKRWIKLSIGKLILKR